MTGIDIPGRPADEPCPGNPSFQMPVTPTFTLRQKLWTPLIVCWIALLLLTIFNARESRSNAYAAREQALIDVIDMAETLVADAYSQANVGKIDVEAAKAAAMVQVGLLRYSKNSGYVTIVNQDSVVLNNPLSPKINGKNMGDFKDARGTYLYREIASLGSSRSGLGYVMYWWPRPGETEPKPKMAFVKRFSPWGWDLVAGDYVDDIEVRFQRSLGKAAVLLIVLGLVISVVAWAVSRNILRAIGGEPALAASIARRIAEGDLSSPVGTTQRHAENSVFHAIEKMRVQLASMVTRIQQSTGVITGSLAEIAAGSRDLSGRTEQQASSLQQTAATMEELTSTVKQNAASAAQARGLAESASAAAKQGGSVMADVIATMSDINRSSKKIVDIIATIDGIAFQTNILALNAAVEAARAGEQGRGFAVVASEVRTLAQRSAAAAKEIKALIGSSVRKVNDGSALVERAGISIQDIVSQVQRVNDIVAEIASANQEQSLGIEQANQAILDMDRVTQQNSALVEESAAATQSVQGEAVNLRQLVEVFRMTGNKAVFDY